MAATADGDCRISAHDVVVPKPNPNPLIGRYVLPGEEFHMNVVTWNIANAARDEARSPLAFRLDNIIRVLISTNKSTPIDALVLLEAGRPSQGLTWTEMAAKIEKETGLSYIGIWRINATPMSFGKALFIDRERVAVNNIRQFWTDKSDEYWVGDYFGNDILTFNLHPVCFESSSFRVVRNVDLIVGIVHFPMSLEARLQLSEYLNDIGHIAQLWMGDFNTFEDDGGEKMIDIITQKGNPYARKNLVEHHDEEAPYTFRAFPHDLISKPEEFRSRMSKHSEVVGDAVDGVIQVRFASTFDRVFTKCDMECKVKVFSPIVIDPEDGDEMVASDHSPVMATTKLFIPRWKYCDAQPTEAQ